jgi:hypothetical protein
MFIDGAVGWRRKPSLERLKTQELYIAGKETVKVLCATCVFSVTLWLLYFEFLQPQRHREHRGCTEKYLV